jgi:hypothetical protein
MYQIRIRSKNQKAFWVANNYSYSDDRRRAYLFESAEAAICYVADCIPKKEYDCEIIREYEYFVGRFTYLDKDKYECKGFAGTTITVDNKRDARAFHSVMELLAYKENINMPKDVIKFEAISNFSDITKSEIGGSFWFRQIMVNINDCVTYVNEKNDLEKIKRIAATAQKSVEELQENFYLIDNLFVKND